MTQVTVGAGGFITVSPPPGSKIDPRLKTSAKNYETAKKNYEMTVAIDKGLKVIEGLFWSKKLLVKTRIQAWEIDNGRTILYFKDTNFPGAGGPRTLNAHHWLSGLPSWKGVGQNGLIDSDFETRSDNWMSAKYYQARQDTNAVIPVSGAYVVSCAGNKNNNFTSRFSIFFYPGAETSADLSTKYGQYFEAACNKKHSGSDMVSFYYKVKNSFLPSGTDVTSTNRDNVQVWRQIVGIIAGWSPKIAVYKKKLADAKAAYKKAAKTFGLPDPFTGQRDDDGGGGSGSGKKTTPDPDKDKGSTGVGDDTLPVIYNLPGANESYFTSNNAALFVSEGDTPKRVDDATKLWEEAGAHKGMIQSYIVPGKLGKNTNWFKPSNVSGDKNNRMINSRRYGFQFLYNPSTVEMSYAGAPQVDIGLEISGQDKVPLIGSGVTSSTLTFQLLLNRMPDMRRLGETRTWSADGKTVTFGIDANAKNNYSWMVPVDTSDTRTPDSELAAIAEMGTMYDVEYLLTTLLGYKLKSDMRGNRFTADIGYLGAYPVELHLGRNLRYLVTIDSFNLNHTIFTKDMIPVFTNLSITCNRLPDFGKKIGSDIKTNTKSN